ncbi:MAG: hypothetical protein K6E37_07365 [Bacteroidales bacterium]|nr:hypothetical protein [Bacteroidales bacterium]
MGFYSERIEALIDAALVDGEITDKERAVLLKRAKEEGIDPDEFEMVLNARCFERNTSKQGELITRVESVDTQTELLKKEGEKKQDKEDKKVLIVLILLIANGFLCYLLIRLL